ncbi:MAG: hypothetical protein WBD40_13020 [Tepidisphaeraceae bacterium]
MNKNKLTDGFVTEDDFVHVTDTIRRDDFQRIVYELITREPEIAFGVSERFDHMLALLEGVSMSIKQRAVIQKHLTLLTWSPLLALARAHRRAWEDFLPSADEQDDGAEGGGA